jgi:protein-S-isoprenylcysteine O-methyltransferase Ste14
MIHAERPSPWWYRQRGSVLGLIFGLGFFLGYLSFGGPPPKPFFIELGSRFAGGRGAEIILWAGVLSALVAWFWRASGTAYLRRNVVFAADVQSDKLIVAGPFRYVRNPLYLGNIFLALAIGIFASPLGFLIIVLGNAVMSVLLAGEESREMEHRFGAVYEPFREAVPAFVPRLTPAEVPGSVEVAPDWRGGLLGEAYCLAFAVAIVPVALFGAAGITAFYAIWVPALIVWALAGWWAGRKQPS